MANVWLYRHVWADRVGGRRSAIWVGSRSLEGVRLRAEARREAHPGAPSTAWARIRAEPDEVSRWSAAVEVFLDAEDAAGVVLDRAYQRGERWWRGRGYRRRAERSFQSAMAAAEVEYAVVRDLVSVRLEHEMARREAEEQRKRILRADQDAAQRRREEDEQAARQRAVADLDGLRVWMLLQQGRVARVHRCDVPPRTPVDGAEGPLTAAELAGVLDRRDADIDRVDWDPEALKAVEAALGAQQFRSWWLWHRRAARPGGAGLAGAGGFTALT